jgi:hypothetical protein
MSAKFARARGFWSVVVLEVTAPTRHRMQPPSRFFT